MNPSSRIGRPLSKTLVAAAVAVFLASCATAPVSPEGSADVRRKLTFLQSDPELAARAPVALADAEVAVRAAEQPVPVDDAALGAHRVYVADRKVDIAIAQASTRQFEDQRVTLGQERERARLDARTLEAEAAHRDAETARGDAENLQREIDALHAEATDRGLVLTLGDIQFSTARADLKVGATSNLNELVSFLSKYPDRNVMIVGHTDDQGSDKYNMELSQRRADAVRVYLVQQGIGSARIASSAMGEHEPIVENDSEGGRQQNRRVEVIIADAASVAAAM
jgi:outer membrane protein OmpA-like peptidoglycan-associated protein